MAKHRSNKNLYFEACWNFYNGDLYKRLKDKFNKLKTNLIEMEYERLLAEKERKK